MGKAVVLNSVGGGGGVVWGRGGRFKVQGSRFRRKAEKTLGKRSWLDRVLQRLFRIPLTVEGAAWKVGRLLVYLVEGSFLTVGSILSFSFRAQLCALWC